MRNRDDGPVKPVRQRRNGSTFRRLGPLPKPIAKTVHELLDESAPSSDDVDEKHAFAPVETYVYLDEWNRPFHRVHRQRCTDEGCSAKNFPQDYLRPGSNPAAQRNWRSSKTDAGLPHTWSTRLYRHARVEHAVADGMPVWIFEGAAEPLVSADRCNVGLAGALPPAALLLSPAQSR